MSFVAGIVCPAPWPGGGCSPNRALRARVLHLLTLEGVMADAPSFDWGKLAAKSTDHLRAPKIPEVPPEIIALAQESFDGRPVLNGEGKPVLDDEGNAVLGHVLEYDFGKDNLEMAKAFAKHMKNAGLHTTPHTSVSVAPDPEGDGSEHVVRWRASLRKGRKAAPSGPSA